MTDEQRRFMHARDRVRSTLLSPVQELLDATAAMIDQATKRADDAELVLAQMRPIWAQGHTSDSMAAQANGSALAQLWAMLGVTDQTAAVQLLERLKCSIRLLKEEGSI